MGRRQVVELTVTERVALVTWRLMAGDVWTTQEIASFLGMSWHGAYDLTCRMSRVLPIHQDEFKRWSRIPEKID